VSAAWPAPGTVVNSSSALAHPLRWPCATTSPMPLLLPISHALPSLPVRRCERLAALPGHLARGRRAAGGGCTAHDSVFALASLTVESLQALCAYFHPRELQLGIPPDSACFLVLNRTLPDGVSLNKADLERTAASVSQTWIATSSASGDAASLA
jgi:hypothetical protein